MNLNNISFILFFFCLIIILIAVQFIFKSNVLTFIQKIILLSASYIFIFLFDPRFCICIFGVTVFTYLSAIILEIKK